MARLTANFEKGTNGAVLATSDAGSGTAWDVVDLTTATYDQSHAYGNQAIKVTTADFAWTTAFGTQVDHYGRFYIYRTSNPATLYAAVYSQVPGGDTRLNITTSGTIQTKDRVSSLSTTTTAINLNAWTRIEYKIHCALAGNGTIEVKIFLSPDSPQPDETLTVTGLDTSSNGQGATSIYFGNPTGTVGNSAFWLDNIVSDTAGYPGPARTGFTMNNYQSFTSSGSAFMTEVVR